MPDTAKNGLLRVNFSLRGFAKVVNQATLSPFTPEPAALEAFGRFLASLDLQPSDPLTFASLPEFRGVDYVGYIVEKERLDPTTGNWIRLEEYRIIGVQACSYKDTRVAYGATYRYRIRTVVKFTCPNSGPAQAAQLQQSVATLLQKVVNVAATQNASLISRLLPNGLQSSANTNAPTSVALSDNVTISVDANGVPKFTYNVDPPAIQSLNSAAANSLNALQSALASSQPISNTTLQSHINTLSSYIPVVASTQTYQSEYLVSYPNRNWQYVVIKNNELPPWPQSLQVVPSTPNRTITVYWLPPPDDKLDLSAVNLYRRNAVGDTWALVASNMPLDQAMYVDTDVQVGNTYIYALTTGNLHGYTSFLSTQVQAQLNASFQFEQKEKDLVWISGPGARPDEPDTIFAAFYDTDEQLIAYNNVTVSPSEQYNDVNTTLILKVQSLDTHEKKEIVLNLANKNT